MTLATRITILLTVLLAACGVVAGVAFHRTVRRSLQAELKGSLDARLAWLEGALDVELEDGELQLDAREEPGGAGSATQWQVSTTDGRVLWASPGVAGPRSITHSRGVTFGDAAAPAVPPSRIVAGDDARDDDASGGGRAGWTDVPLSNLPPAVVQAARTAVPGLDLRRSFRKTRLKKRPPGSDATFELHGTAGGREYALRLDGSGSVLRVKDRAVDPFAEYSLPSDATRLDLVLTAQASAAEADRELSRLARTLWTVGPLMLALTGAVLALLIRWQLRPLGRMAEQAATIGPRSTATGIDVPGTSLELVRLREAINGMLRRLAEGLDRERQFAATAAHELRTPLAQMRATVEVALRRTREGPEYREALEQVSADVERLQKLVVGLLQLTRGSDAARSRGTPVPLLPLLHHAAKRCGPVEIGADAEDDGLGDGPWVYGDPDLLHAAVCNVLENAARYAPAEPSSVHIEADRNSPTVRVVISDRGPGIGEGDRERIFQPLTRLEPPGANADGADGFGLGLAVARATARAFGGDLTCRARADGLAGAAFVFTFQRAQPPDLDAASHPAKSNPLTTA